MWKVRVRDFAVTQHVGQQKHFNALSDSVKLPYLVDDV